MPSILVVDDEPAIVELLMEVLHEEGYTVLAAYDGRAGLALAREHLPDAVITDIHMPYLDGIALSRQLRAGGATCHIPVIAMSAMQPRSLEAMGVVAFIAKPFDFLYVLGVLARHLAPAA